MATNTVAHLSQPRRCWEFEHEFGAVADFALHGDAAAVASMILRAVASLTLNRPTWSNRRARTS